jgi:signal peptide peptidase SppA
MKLDSRWRSVKRLSQYVGAWAIEPGAGAKLADMVQRIDAPSHLASMEGMSVDQPRAGVGRDGVAVLEIRGPVTKYGTSLSEAGSTLRMRQLIREYAADRKVKSLMLLIDSPGGTVCGTPDLADAIAKFGKPTAAYIEDCGCSAAYWIAAQCDRVYCNSAASVGSIGVYSVLVDSSEQAGMLGLKVHVISTGPLKGAGVDGTVITDEQLADAQRSVDSINRLFTAAVVAGRGFTDEQVASVATGQVWIGEEAVSLGLVDGISTAPQVRRDLIEAANNAAKEGYQMSVKPNKKKAAKAEATKHRRIVAEDVMPPMEDEEDVAPPADEEAVDGEDDMCEDEAEAEDMPEEEAATLKQLKAALPDSDPAFRERCLDKGLTLSAAKDAWMGELRTRLNAATNATAKGRGVAPLKTATAGPRVNSGNVREQFESLVRETMQARGLSKLKATAHVVRNHKALHEAYIEFVNSARAAK